MSRLIVKRILNKQTICNLRAISISKIHNTSFINEQNNKGVDKFGNLYEVPEYPFSIPLQDRSKESEENLRRRLVYQCRKRGILETDLILSTFVGKYLNDLSYEDCKQFDQLLNENDWDIYYWATEERTPPANIEGLKVFQLIKEHAKNREKKVLRMPELL